MGRRILLALLWSLVAGSLGAQTLGTYLWDDPVYLARAGARYPTAVDNGRMAAAFWQERRQGEGWPQSFLSVTVRSQGDSSWTVHRNVLGPFTIAGTEAQIYSAVLSPGGTFWVSVLGEEGQLILYRSDDGAATFQEEARLNGSGNLLSPKLFFGADDQPILMATQADAVPNFRIVSSRRAAGKWTPLAVVTDSADQRQSFSPTVAVLGKTLVLIYQSLFTAGATETTGQRISYQLYRKVSTDGGATWGPSVRVTDFADELADTADQIDNQRPTAYTYANRLFVAWERRSGRGLPLIEVASFNAQGVRLDAQAVTNTNFTARSPLFYTFRDRLRLAWFDNRNDTYDLFLSAWDPAGNWDTAERLTSETGNSVFGQPAHVGDDLYFFWQNNFNDNPGLVMLGPDRHADPPTLQPLDFKVGVKRNKADFAVQVVYPRDPSGVKGFNVVLTQDPAAEVPHDRLIVSKDKQWGVTLPSEGRWYLAVAVQDLAKNWSPPAYIPLDLKTTPPGPVAFNPDPTDARGYLTSNTFSLSWKPTTDDAVSYSWRLDRVGDALTPALLASLKALAPVPNPLGTGTEATGDNFEDGLWALSVTAFDEAGNQGPVSSHFFRLNKFRPYTLIQFVETQQDAFGRVQIAIHGRGFTAGGAVDHVYIDRDGQAPWDYDLGPADFHLASDRLIDSIKVEGLAEGIYRIGVNHPDRGRLFTPEAVLKIEPTGTVKIGDFRNLDRTVWEFFQGVSVFFSVHALEFWAIMVLLALGALGSVRLLAQAWAERLRIDHQAAVLFTDTEDKWARRAGRSIMKTKGLSLTFKFAASILGLMATVILMLSLTLLFYITENSQQTLGKALQQRTQVLLDSLATGARSYLPIGNIAGLGDLPDQTSAMKDEAIYATITGPSGEQEKKAGHSFVYASNDPDRLKKIDTPTLIPGTSILNDPVEPLWTTLQAELNQKAEVAVGDLVRQTQALVDQEKPLSDKITGGKKLTSDETKLLTQLEDQVSTLKKQIGAKLVEVGGTALSYPEFNLQNLLASQNKLYLFYQPYLYYVAGDPTYVRGLVRIEVSSALIEKQIVASRDLLILVTAVIALIALVLGLVGSLLLSALTINPIRKLVAGVEKIRDTEDKADLADHVIDIKTRDELEDLASTVNQMTQGLVHAAEANKDLLLGKTTQKTFVPLDTNSKGRKLTTGFLDLPEAEIFGYYEGAKGVSGDYYDFRQLDNKDGDNPKSPWYGFIKCDVSGKGIVGALIMFTVASVVVNFFRNWKAARDAKDIQLTGMVANVNDLLESLQFKGRFAALNTGILNVKTGKIRLCHAGDNVVHVWRGRTLTFETTTLPMAPATGQIEDMMARSLYKHHDLILEPGDTLLFYTDGIEESQSKFRDSDYNVVAYFDPEDPSTKTTPGASKMIVGKSGREEEVKATDNEPLHEPATPANPRMGTPASEGNERLNDIVQAFYTRGTYRLVKKYPARPDETFTFNFADCDGSARQVITALVSIDRIFRLVADPKATADDKIKLDVIQKEFLEKHFVEYKRYFKGPGVKMAEPNETIEDSEYIWFDHLKEDDQFDDLTLLAIRKK